MTTVARTTRRNLLGAALLAPLAATAAAMPAPPVPAMHDDEAELRRLIAAWRTAQARSDAYHEAVYGPRLAEWRRRDAAIPHVPTLAGFAGRNGQVHLRTDSPGAVATAKVVCRDRPSWADAEDYQQVCAELLDNVQRREKLSAAIRRRLRVDAAYDVVDALENEASAALDRAFAHPVSSARAVSVKLELMESLSGWDDGSWVEDFTADIRRLVGEARA